MKDTIKLYRELIKNKIIDAPIKEIFYYCLILTAIILVEKTQSIIYILPAISILTVFPLMGILDNKKYNLLVNVPIKTEEIIKIPYLAVYILVIVTHSFAAIFSQVYGYYNVIMFLPLAALSLVVANLLMPIKYISGMKHDDSAGYALIAFLLFIIVAMINITMLRGLDGTGFKYIIIIVVISIFSVVYTLKKSYRWTVNSVYKGK